MSWTSLQRLLGTVGGVFLLCCVEEQNACSRAREGGPLQPRYCSDIQGLSRRAQTPKILAKHDCGKIERILRGSFNRELMSGSVDVQSPAAATFLPFDFYIGLPRLVFQHAQCAS